MITTILKPVRRNKQNNVASLLKKLISHLREQWPDTLIIVRGDSHFTSKDFMEWCADNPFTGYITGLTGNKKLHGLARVTIDSAEREYKQYGRPVKQCHSFMYQAGSWGIPQKVVVKVEVSAMGTNVRYVVSKLAKIRAKELFKGTGLPMQHLKPFGKKLLKQQHGSKR